MFWQRPVTPGTSGFYYAFGSSTGSARCYNAGSYLSLRSWGNLSGYIDSATDPDSLPGWSHWCVVVDDVAGTGQWYVNGVADGAPLSFTPGTFTFSGGNLIIGAYGTTSTSLYTRDFDIDDFRVYGRALTPAEVAASGLGENAAATTFGTGCPGPGGVPTIGTSGGLPQNGNGTFQVDVANLESGAPAVIVVGIQADAGGLLPYDISFLIGAGCVAETVPLVTVGLISSGTASVPLPVPVGPPPFAGDHLYAQVVVLGSMGAASPALDINLQP